MYYSDSWDKSMLAVRYTAPPCPSLLQFVKSTFHILYPTASSNKEQSSAPQFIFGVLDNFLVIFSFLCANVCSIVIYVYSMYIVCTKHPSLFKILMSAWKGRTSVTLMPTALTGMHPTIVPVRMGTVEMASIVQVSLFLCTFSVRLSL